MENNINTKIKKIIKLSFLLISAYYFYLISNNPLEYSIVHSIHLVFHEAGHPTFGLLGIQFLQMAGGTIMQLLIPLVFIYYFFSKRDIYSTAFIILWLASSFFDVAAYAKDAILMNLDLLGGDNVIHDWNYLLSTLGVLKYTAQISSSIYFLGIVSLVSGLAIGIYDLFFNKEVDTV